jgi:hypothetical protein
MRRRPARCSSSVSRSSNPKPRGDVMRKDMAAIECGVAHLFLVRTPALLADQRRTDEASRPDTANHLPAHLSLMVQAASCVRSVNTVGSPQSCSGARYGAQTISGRFRGRNLVGLAPQSKPFFSHLECEGLMAKPV